MKNMIVVGALLLSTVGSYAYIDPIAVNKGTDGFSGPERTEYCHGIIKKNLKTTRFPMFEIDNDPTDPAAYVCAFNGNSSVGRRIFRTCKVDTYCNVLGHGPAAGGETPFLYIQKLLDVNR